MVSATKGAAVARIGILTGGGDCPGLNAVIRAVVRKGVNVYGHAILGYRDGWRGVRRSTSSRKGSSTRSSSDSYRVSPCQAASTKALRANWRIRLPEAPSSASPKKVIIWAAVWPGSSPARKGLKPGTASRS